MPPRESPLVEAITVAWMLCLLATVIAELSGIVVRVAMLAMSASAAWHVISQTLLFVAFVGGTLTIVLTPLAARLRREPPPRVIVVMAILAGIVPISLVALRVFAG